MFHNVHCQRGFAHRGSRGDHHHFRRVQSVGHFVELLVMGFQSRKAFLAVAILKITEHLFENLRGAGGGFAGAFLIDLLDFAFHLIEQPVHLALVLVGLPHHLGAGAHRFAQQVFVPHDVEIILEVGR